MKDSTFGLVDVSALGKEATLKTRYAGQAINVNNPSLGGNTKLSDIFGNSEVGLQGILNLTSEQKNKIAKLEEKATTEYSAQEFYSEAVTYYHAMLADIAAKQEADARHLSAASFGATSTLGATEKLDYQAALVNGGVNFTQAQRDTLYAQLKGFALPSTNDNQYIRTITGFNEETGQFSKPNIFKAIKALKGKLPSDVISAYNDMKFRVGKLRSIYSTVLDISNDYNRAIFAGDSSGVNKAVKAFNAFYSKYPKQIVYRDIEHRGFWQDKLKALPHFKVGGYTGDGNINDIAGITHKREYVVPAKGALAIKENKNETRELKKISQHIETNNIILKKLLRVIKEWDSDGVKRREA